ncbi:hypothetical protein LTR08_008753 [Meristemomyces frigidus]|nr:hypothetical protein LTR08_008753 [Meristemomyces frigidus]
MEPLVALELAGEVIDFVKLAITLVGTAREIAARGGKDENIEIETQTRVLRDLSTRLSSSVDGTAAATQDDLQLKDLCEQSVGISKELLVVFDGLKPSNGSGKVTLETWWIAVKSEWKGTEIHKLQERLDRIDSRAHTLITKTYGDKVLESLSHLERSFNAVGGRRDLADLKDMEREINELRKTKSQANSKALVNLMLSAADKGMEYTAETLILEQLRFDDIDRRMQALDRRPAHEKSYLWLDDGDSNLVQGQAPADFQQWLGTDEKLYWITGKPGSGKSTLMKFLYQRPKTREQLHVWTKGEPVLTAAYFFWELGRTDLLQTQEGLLRTLIFQILRHKPDMIRLVYPDFCNSYSHKRSETPTPHTMQDRADTYSGMTMYLTNTIEDLFGRLKTISEQCSQSCTYICFFIDGLDEYNGDPGDLTQLIDSMAQMANVKLCIASRPDNPFLKYDKVANKLVMQNFNSEDIRAYVYDILEHDDNYKERHDKDTECKDLIEDILNNAQGVFLWVYLVMGSLREGFQNMDTVEDLRRRLGDLHADLYTFFRHMLDGVPEMYRDRSATMFDVTLCAREPLTATAYWFVSEGERQLDKTHEVKPWSLQENTKHRRVIVTRLNAYCKGLLEVHHHSLPQEQESLSSSTLFAQKVDFLHRTPCYVGSLPVHYPVHIAFTNVPISVLYQPKHKWHLVAIQYTDNVAASGILGQQTEAALSSDAKSPAVRGVASGIEDA